MIKINLLIAVEPTTVVPETTQDITTMATTEELTSMNNEEPKTSDSEITSKTNMSETEMPNTTMSLSESLDGSTSSFEISTKNGQSPNEENDEKDVVESVNPSYGLENNYQTGI